MNHEWSEQELDEKSVWAFQHPHNAKERRKIRNDIADEIEEILVNEGFVRCRTTFFRAKGDDLLQLISVRCLERGDSRKLMWNWNRCITYLTLYGVP